MKRYAAQQTVDEGIYFNVRKLAFRSIEERGRLPGDDGESYVRLPALVALFVGLLVSLAYVIFLPVIGFVMLGSLLVEKLFGLFRRAAGSAERSMQPAWLPARAYLSRGRSRRQGEGPEAEETKDEWADEVAEELDKDHGTTES